MDDSHTPRGLIENFIEHAETEKTVRLDVPPTKVRKRVNKQKHAAEASNSTITPRTMLENFIQEGELEQSTRVRKVTRRSVAEASPLKKSKISPSPHSSRRQSAKTDLRKEATIKHFLNESTKSKVTPRTLVENFLANAPESSTFIGEENLSINRTQAEEELYQRKRMSSVGESYYLPSTAPAALHDSLPIEAPDVSSTSKKQRYRKKKTIDPEELARRLALQDREDDERTKNISVTTNIAAMDPNSDETGFTANINGYDKTEDIQRKLSVAHMSLPPVTPATAEVSLQQSLINISTPTSSGSNKKHSSEASNDKETSDKEEDSDSEDEGDQADEDNEDVEDKGLEDDDDEEVEVAGTQTLAQPHAAASSYKKPKRNKSNKPKPAIPRQVTKELFSRFTPFKFGAEVLDEIERVAEQYWEGVADDLAAYTAHAGRVTVERSDIELLFKRQGFVTESQSLDTLIHKYLPMEYSHKLIPCIRSVHAPPLGKKKTPKK